MTRMASETRPPAEYLTVPELARLLRTTPNAIYVMRNKGKGPRAARGHGGRILYPRDEVDRWLRENLEERGNQPEEAVGA
jgi:predicted DNA-binding transcriptional regulator AlpA